MGKNLWRDITKRAGLLGRPHLSAVRPDSGSLARERTAREARLRAKTREMKARLRLRDEQVVLGKYKEEFDAHTREVEARNAEVDAAHLPVAAAAGPRRRPLPPGEAAGRASRSCAPTSIPPCSAR